MAYAIIYDYNSDGQLGQFMQSAVCKNLIVFTMVDKMSNKKQIGKQIISKMTKFD